MKIPKSTTFAQKSWNINTLIIKIGIVKGHFHYTPKYRGACD